MLSITATTRKCNDPRILQAGAASNFHSTQWIYSIFISLGDVGRRMPLKTEIHWSNQRFSFKYFEQSKKTGYPGILYPMIDMRCKTTTKNLDSILRNVSINQVFVPPFMCCNLDRCSSYRKHEIPHDTWIVPGVSCWKRQKKGGGSKC